jgi:purine-binding chemotaxis protein CheW
MAVSQAPNMVYDFGEIPDYCRKFTVQGKNGYSFNQEIKDAILFEYHDIVNENSLPDLDIILIRDVVSFLPESEQKRIISCFSEKLKNRGIVILGRNEELSGVIWQSFADDPVSGYFHNV